MSSEKFSIFRAWLEEVKCDNVEAIAFCKGKTSEQGFIVCASVEIEPERPLLGFPSNIILDTEACRRFPPVWDHLQKERIISKNPFGWSLSKNPNDIALPVIVLLAYISNLCLLSADEANPCPDATFFRPYINILPKREIVFSSEEVSRYIGSNHDLFRRANQKDHSAREDYLRHNLDKLGFSVDHFCWAAQVYWSRALEIPCDSRGRGGKVVALVPFLDSLNHRPGALHELQVVRPPNETSRPVPAIQLIAKTAVGNGDEITINYGGKPNAELILHFGFAIPENKMDYVTFTVFDRNFKFFQMQESLPEDLLTAARMFQKNSDADSASVEKENLIPIYVMPKHENYDLDILWEGIGTPLPTYERERESLNLLLDIIQENQTRTQQAIQSLELVSIPSDTEKDRHRSCLRSFHALLDGELRSYIKLMSLIKILSSSLSFQQIS